MICPLCLKKCRTQVSKEDDIPEFHCNSIVVPDPPGNKEYSHYTKCDVWGITSIHYQEEAIILPFKVINYFSNTDYSKPRSEIYKYKLTDHTSWYGTTYKAWGWIKILDLPYILEILPYKKMQNRLKNIMLFS